MIFLIILILLFDLILLECRSSFSFSSVDASFILFTDVWVGVFCWYCNEVYGYRSNLYWSYKGREKTKD